MTGRGGGNRRPQRGNNELLATDATLGDVISAVNGLNKRLVEQETVTKGMLTTLEGDK